MATIGHEPFEQLRVIFVDTANRVIGDDLVREGTIDFVQVSNRDIVARALEIGADGVILAHNHPSGLLEPSRADQTVTRTLHDVLRALNMRLLDHVIVAQGGWTSMRQRGFL